MMVFNFPLKSVLSAIKPAHGDSIYEIQNQLYMGKKINKL